jgi:hypothetical protein
VHVRHKALIEASRVIRLQKMGVALIGCDIT